MQLLLFKGKKKKKEKERLSLSIYRIPISVLFTRRKWSLKQFHNFSSMLKELLSFYMHNSLIFIMTIYKLFFSYRLEIQKWTALIKNISTYSRMLHCNVVKIQTVEYKSINPGMHQEGYSRTLILRHMPISSKIKCII